MNDFDFIGWLNGIMEEKGMNETEIAAFFGTSRAAISHYMNGNRMPMLYTFLQMLDSLGLKMEIVKKLKNPD